MRDRSAFLYFEPPTTDKKDHAQCGTCANFLSATGRCFWLGADDDVDASDTCAMYGHGKPNDDPKAKPTGTYTKKEVGFFDGRVQCHRCNGYDDRDKSNIHCDVYVQLNRMLPKLYNLETKVTPHACCNAWEGGDRNPKQFGPYGPMPDADDPKAGGMLFRLLKHMRGEK